jgi:hypothetical protein
VNVLTWLRSEWDRVAGYGLVLLGALFLLLGYHGVKTSPFLAEELAFIASGGLGGIFCLGLGVGLLLSADLHDEWRKLDRIEAALRGEALPETAELIELLRAGAAPKDSPTPGPVGAGMMAAVTVRSPSPGRTPGRPVGTAAMALDWRGDHLRRALGLAVLGLLVPCAVMAMGWRQANTTADLDVAAHGVGIAIFGLALAVAVIGGYSVWLRVRLVGRQARVFGTYLRGERLVRRQRLSPNGHHPAPPASEVFTAPGLHRYHQAGCPMLAGLAVSAVPRDEVRGDLAACDVCAG